MLTHRRPNILFVMTWELFDLQEDPHELTNRYDDPAYAQWVVALKAKLQNLRTQYKDLEDMQDA